MTVIDLQQVKAARNAPDADCVSQDADGNELNLFSIDYQINGREFSFPIWARSFDEAESHVEAIRSSAVLAGQITARGRI